MKQLHLRIYGLVQGVYYRASTRNEARRLQLYGWVQNCPDGSVELLAEGEEDALGALLAWCRQGPPAARVDRVETTWGPSSGAHDGFRVRY